VNITCKDANLIFYSCHSNDWHRWSLTSVGWLIAFWQEGVWVLSFVISYFN